MAQKLWAPIAMLSTRAVYLRRSSTLIPTQSASHLAESTLESCMLTVRSLSGTRSTMLPTKSSNCEESCFHAFVPFPELSKFAAL